MTAAAKAERITLDTHGVRAALRVRYPRGEYAMLEEVRDGAGFSANRSADALVMGLWPSRGLTLTGIEIKVSRSDWARELKNPAKAEAIAQFCDEWYIAAGFDGLVMDGELPAGWGLLVPDARGGMRVKVPAPKLEAKPVTRGFLAAMFRRAQASGAAVQEITAVREATAREMEGRAKGERLALQCDYDSLRQRVAAFENASGVSLSQPWQDGDKIGAAVRTVLDNRGDEVGAQLRRVLATLERITNGVRDEVAALGGAA